MRELTTNIISEDKIKFIKQLATKYPFVVFGGSLALNAYGIISREIRDLDLFVEKDKILTIPDKFRNNDFRSSQEGEDNSEKYKVGDLNIDLFRRKDKLEFVEYDLQGVKIKLHTIDRIINSKIEYFKQTGNKKHSDDIKSFNKYKIEVNTAKDILLKIGNGISLDDIRKYYNI